MVSFRKSVEIAAPLHVVFEQWQRLEDFPKFLPGVISVERTGESRFRWRSTLMGNVLEWEAEICDEVPDRRMSWRSVSGLQNSGTVTVEALSMERTLLTIGVSYEPTGLLGHLGGMLGVIDARINGLLYRFRDYIEERIELSRYEA